mmetsp:Transcript_13116/g.32145  ORF Transcript_13116/g.32145 Transcript_13116/m.32145 type:complete len:272 (+) Transcript_13116:234-1049(+)
MPQPYSIPSTSSSSAIINPTSKPDRASGGRGDDEGVPHPKDLRNSSHRRVKDNVEKMLQEPGPDSLPGYHYPAVNASSHTLSYMVPAPPRFCYKYKVGRMYVCSTKNVVSDSGETQLKITCMLGACWPMTFVTMALISAITLFALSGFLPQLGIVWTIATFVVLGTNLISLGLTGMQDPGIVRTRSDVEAPDVKRRWNSRAQRYIRRGEAYCEESQVVVEEMDHFCPWTGTVIAGGNMMYFQIFLTSLCSLMGFIALVCFMSIQARTVKHK